MPSMSTLVPSYSLSDFKKLKKSEIKQLKSCEISSDGEYLCTIIIPPVNGGVSIADYNKTQAEYLALRANTCGGKSLEELREQKEEE